MIDLKTLANAPRFLSIDMVQAANSGHPGLPLGMASVGYALFADNLNYNPKNPKFPAMMPSIISVGDTGILMIFAIYGDKKIIPCP